MSGSANRTKVPKGRVNTQGKMLREEVEGQEAVVALAYDSFKTAHEARICLVVFQGWPRLCTASSQKIRHGAAEGHQLPGSHHNGEAFRVPAVPQRALQHRLQTIGLHACREDGPGVGLVQNLESHFRRQRATRVHHGALQHNMGTKGQQESFSQGAVFGTEKGDTARSTSPSDIGHRRSSFALSSYFVARG